MEIVDETDQHQPSWICLGCGEGPKKGGAARIAYHLLGRGACKKCDLSKSTPEFELKLQKVIDYVEINDSKKARKDIVRKVNEATGLASFSCGGPKQSKLNFYFDARTSVEVDATIAEFFFGCNISANTAEHPLFARVWCMPLRVLLPHTSPYLGSSSIGP